MKGKMDNKNKKLLEEFLRFGFCCRGVIALLCSILLTKQYVGEAIHGVWMVVTKASDEVVIMQR